jgi:Cu2+-exporting ATPase
MTTTPSTSQRTECRHCGTAFTPVRADEAFCCGGCAFVHDLIQEQGLGKFYELRDRAVAPVKATVLQRRDYSWLNEVEAEASASAEREFAAAFELQGISCIGCVWLIERVFHQQPGALKIDINAQLGELHLLFQPGVFSLKDFAATIQRFGYLLGPPGTKTRGESDALLTRVGICAALALNTMLFTLPGYLGMGADFLFADLFRLLTVVFASLSFLVGGVYFIKRAVAGLRRGALHIDLPIALGVTAAYIGSLAGWVIGEERFMYFDFVAVFMLLMLLGRWTQERVLERNRQLLLGWNPRADTVRRYADKEGEGGAGLTCEVRELRRGDQFSVRMGQSIPVRSRLLSARVEISLEWINGEPEARLIHAGDSIPSGAVCLSQGGARCAAVESWEDSLLGRLLQMTPKADRFTGLEKILKIYILLVIIVGMAGFAVWAFHLRDIVSAFQVLISVLVVSCPCALGVAYPLTNEMAVVRLRRIGLFVRAESFWARLKRIRRVVFDKTGTLTLENPVLVDRTGLDNLTEEARGVLWHLVEGNLHPVCRGLREALLGQRGQPVPGAGEVSEVVGKGLEVSVTGARWRLGRSDWALAGSGSGDAAEISADSVLSRDGVFVAAFNFREEPRPDARAEIQNFRSIGWDVHILSGDRPEKVRHMTDALGLPPESGHGNCSPDDKADWIRRHDPDRLLFVGDGANDSLAFDLAGCTGTPVADSPLLQSKADFYFFGRSLNALRELLAAGRIRARTARQVFLFAILYNIAVVIVALAGHMHPLLAAILMPLSSLVTLVIVRLGFRARSS